MNHVDQPLVVEDPSSESGVIPGLMPSQYGAAVTLVSGAHTITGAFVDATGTYTPAPMVVSIAGTETPANHYLVTCSSEARPDLSTLTVQAMTVANAVNTSDTSTLRVAVFNSVWNGGEA
jgi:hypothetical protein